MRCNVCAAPLLVAGYNNLKNANGFIYRRSPRYAPCRNIGDARKHFRPTIAHGGVAMDEMPTAREVRDVMGYVTIDGFRVSHHDNWGDERFPWRVEGPTGSDTADFPDGRAHLDEFPRYSEAVAFARKRARMAWSAAKVSQ